MEGTGETSRREPPHGWVITSSGAKFQTTFFRTDYRLERSLHVKLQDWMSNSVDPDETAHYEPSHLDLCCLQKPIIIACGSERVNGSMLGKEFSRRHFEIVFLFFPEHRLWHFMQTWYMDDWHQPTVDHCFSEPSFSAWKNFLSLTIQNAHR